MPGGKIPVLDLQLAPALLELRVPVDHSVVARGQLVVLHAELLVEFGVLPRSDDHVVVRLTGDGPALDRRAKPSFDPAPHQLFERSVGGALLTCDSRSVWNACFAFSSGP